MVQAPELHKTLSINIQFPSRRHERGVGGAIKLGMVHSIAAKSTSTCLGAFGAAM